MTYRNYRNSLHKQMLAYLRFMRCADTDQQLLELNTEVNELRTKVHNLDQLTASQMLENVQFTEVEYESFGFPTVIIPDAPKVEFVKQKSKSLCGVKKAQPKYLGVFWNKTKGKYTATVVFKGRHFLNADFDDPEEAVKNRDLTIIKFHLPFPLQVLKKV